MVNGNLLFVTIRFLSQTYALLSFSHSVIPSHFNMCLLIPVLMFRSLFSGPSPECDRRKKPRGECSWRYYRATSLASSDDRRRHVRRRHSGGALQEGTPNNGVSASILMNPWPMLLPGMSPLAPLAMGASVGHMGCCIIRIHTF